MGVPIPTPPHMVLPGAKGLSSARYSARRTRPVLWVRVSMQFKPAEIPRSAFECGEQVVSDQILGQSSICLYIDKRSKNLLGSRESLPSNPGHPDLWGPPAPDAFLPPCPLSSQGVPVSLNAVSVTAYR